MELRWSNDDATHSNDDDGVQAARIKDRLLQYIHLNVNGESIILSKKSHLIN